MTERVVVSVMGCAHKPDAVLLSLADPRAQEALLRSCAACGRLYVSGRLGPLTPIPAPAAPFKDHGGRCPKPAPYRVRTVATCSDCGAVRYIVRTGGYTPAGRCRACSLLRREARRRECAVS